MKVDSALWGYESQKAKEDLVNAEEMALLAARSSGPGYQELARRLIVARYSELADVFGWLNPEFGGWPAMWPGTGNITRRLQFVSDFISYHLQDDGDPGIAAIRWADDFVGPKTLVPWTGHKLERPLVIRNREHPAVVESWAETRITPERVIEVIDWHERDAIRYQETCQDLLENDPGVSRILDIDEETKLLRAWAKKQKILPEKPVLF